MSTQDQLLAAAALLRARYETAPSIELPMLAAVIAYIETVAEQDTPVDQPTSAKPLWQDAAHDDAPHTSASAETVWGTFRETAAGGIVTPDDGSPIDLPHGVVSASGMRHGDRVTLTPKDGASDQFWFTASGKSVPLPAPDVRELVLVLAAESTGYSVEVDGMRLRVKPILSHLVLRAGDVVTVRCTPSELGLPGSWGYVVRVHEVPGGATVSPLRRRRTVRRPPHSNRPRPEAAPPVDVASPGRDDARTPPRILIVGGTQRDHRRYGDALRGLAAVDWSQGSRLTKSLRGRLESADGVVLITQHMSHSVSTHALKVLRGNKPFIYARSRNISGFADQVRDELLPSLANRDASAG